jgi:hypothetical protein
MGNASTKSANTDSAVATSAGGDGDVEDEKEKNSDDEEDDESGDDVEAEELDDVSSSLRSVSALLLIGELGCRMIARALKRSSSQSCSPWS